MKAKLLVALLLLLFATIPVSIAVDLLVWPGSQEVDDIPGGDRCGTIWFGVIPVGGYCE